MPDATARYIVAGEDRTKAMLASIRGGFTNLDKGIRSTLRGLNLAFGLFLGVQVKQAFQRVIRAASDSNKDFAASINDVRASFQNLMVPKTGMPGAIESMKELSAILKDPSVIAAADSLTSTMIIGFSKVAGVIAKIIAGLNVLITSAGDEVEKLRKEIEDVERRIRMAKIRSGGRADTSELEAYRDLLAKRQMTAIEGPRPAAGPDRGALMDIAGAAGGARAVRRFNVMQEYAENVKWLETFDKDATQFEQQRKEAFKDLDEAVKKSYDENAEAIYKQFSDEQDARQELYDWRRDQEMQVQREAVEAFKALWDGAFQFWMHRSQRTARSFLEALLATATNKLLMKAFDELFSLIPSGKGSSSGFWGAIVSRIGSLFGGSRAGGGDIEAGKAYQVHKDEMIFSRGTGTVVPAAAFAGGVNVYNYNTFNNMRDVSDAKLAAAGQQISDVTVARLRDMKRRGQF